MNKRSLWGSLFRPREETIQVCHAQLQDPNFFRLLLRVDEELAGEAKRGGCPCGGVLHRANYPRKPRGCLNELRVAYGSRFSFCCNRCRRRTTSISVRFLGRRVYLALTVVLLSEALNVPVRTLARWRHWWREDFPLTPLWQATCARFMPPVATDAFPASLLAVFLSALQNVK